MKLDFRSILILAVPILVLLFVVAMIFDWHVNYAEFRPDLVGWALAIAVVVLLVLDVTNPKPGRPSLLHRLFSFTVQAFEARWPYVNLLRRDMLEDDHGWASIPKDNGGKTAKSHRKFASTVGGHVAWLISNLKQLVGQGASGQPRLMLARSRA